jgi:hypothetical protein
MARVSSWSNRGLQRTNRYGGVSLSGNGCSLACKCCCRVCFLSTSKDAADVLEFICGKIASIYIFHVRMDELIATIRRSGRTGLTCSGLNSLLHAIPLYLAGARHLFESICRAPPRCVTLCCFGRRMIPPEDPNQSQT